MRSYAGFEQCYVEAGDFAGATSSAATKIVHGGVRYLEEAIKGADLQEYRVLVRALHERVRMLENAPHLTRMLEFLVPSYHWIDVAYLDIGLKIYDWLAGPGRISPSKFLSREETLKRMPRAESRRIGRFRRICRWPVRRCEIQHHAGADFRHGGRKCAELCKGHRFPAGMRMEKFLASWSKTN